MSVIKRIHFSSLWQLGLVIGTPIIINDYNYLSEYSKTLGQRYREDVNILANESHDQNCTEMDYCSVLLSSLCENQGH